jgi:hypothetical protein
LRLETAEKTADPRFCPASRLLVALMIARVSASIRAGDPLGAGNMRRTHRMAATAVCMLLSASFLSAGPQRGGNGGGGGGDGQRVAVPRDGGGGGGGGGAVRPVPNGGGHVATPYYGTPYYATRGSFVFVGGYFYDPFYGPYPWWPASAYGWGYSPVFDYRAEVRIQATPREAAVYVDGFYAGVVDDFDGTFQRLPLTPGGHRIELYLEGFQTIRKNLYLQPGATLKLRETLTPVAAGEKSEPPEVAPPVPPPPDGTYNQPNGNPPRGVPPSARRGPDRGRGDGEGFGTLVLHVQPREAEVSIDGQRWLTSGEGQFEVQLPAGRHRIEVQLQGFERFSSEVDVRDDGPTPINVSLTRGR